MTPRLVLVLVVLAMIWGASFLLIKLAVGGMSPVQLVLWRVACGAVVLLLIVAARRQPLPTAPALLAHLAVLAVVSNLVPFFLFGWGELRVTSGMAGVLNGTTPLFTLVVASAALPEEHLGRNRLAGLALGFLGVVLVVAPWRGGGENALAGQLACLGAAACYGVGFVYTRRFVANRGYPPLALSAVQLTLATVLLGLAAPVLATDPVRLDAAVVLSATTLGAVGTGLAYLLYYRLITEAGATSASMVTYLVPVFAVALGVLALGEPVGWPLFAGAAVVVAGVAVAEGRLATPGAQAPVVSEQEVP